MVTTVEVQRLMYILQPLVQSTTPNAIHNKNNQGGDSSVQRISECTKNSSNTFHPFFLVGPDGCGKTSLLHCCFASQPGVHVSTVHCSSETNAFHALEKIEQECILYNSATGRVYRPRDCAKLVLIFKNVNLPKPDKYGTVQLHAFLHQLITYKGFYNNELDWIGLDKVQIVATMNAASSPGRHVVDPRLLSVVQVIAVSYP
uniref:Cytoplasmic dynein 2 heavy chain 1 n=1 Tax=Lygus hesperus TaxID=30085 RepID=A0A0A9YBL0_LYGHE